MSRLSILAVCWLANAHAATPAVHLEPGANGAWVVRISDSGGHSVDVAVDSNSTELPSLLGTFDSVGNDRIFRPRFPLQPGLPYRVTVASSPPTVLKFSIPTSASASTRITAIYPSSNVLPENQLKFYLHFSQPMARGDAYRWIELIDAGGRKIDAPFLELGEELWNADNTRLTLYFDPGRVKSDLLPGREMGAPLRAGHAYTLRIDAAWPDATGRKLEAPVQKHFRVAPADRTSPDPKLWRIQPPRSATSDPLVVEFPEPLEHALLMRMLAVSSRTGQRIEGEVAVDRGETRWRFTPATPWRAGSYTLRAFTSLEDLAGNKLNRLFEFQGARTPEQRAAPESTLIDFEIVEK